MSEQEARIKFGFREVVRDFFAEGTSEEDYTKRVKDSGIDALMQPIRAENILEYPTKRGKENIAPAVKADEKAAQEAAQSNQVNNKKEKTRGE